MGRRPKLTPAIEKAIVEAVGLGASFRDAAKAAGVAEQTLHRWRSMGVKKGARKPYRELSERIEEAEGQLVTKYLEAIRRSFTAKPCMDRPTSS